MTEKSVPTPALDLDAIIEEVEQSGPTEKATEPFIVKGVGPKKIDVTFENPQDLAWQDTQAVAEAFEANDLRTIFDILIDDGDQLEAWDQARVPGPVAGKTIELWMKHHGWDLRRGRRVNREERRRGKKKR